MTLGEDALLFLKEVLLEGEESGNGEGGSGGEEERRRTGGEEKRGEAINQKSGSSSWRGAFNGVRTEVTGLKSPKPQCAADTAVPR